MFARLTIGQSLLILATLFIVALASIVLYTMLTLDQQKSDALVIDIAGRQRMLNQMFMKEIVLASQGHEANYRYTAEVWKGSLRALLDGGQAVLLGRRETVTLPPTHDPLIREKLLEQQGLIAEFVSKAEAFVSASRDNPVAPRKLQELRTLSQHLNEVTLAAGRLFRARSDMRVASMVKWEVGLGLCVVVLGGLLTLEVRGASRQLIEEVAQRKRAEQELRQSEERRVEAFRQSDELKSALLSLVSHELRTPLTAIKSSIGSLRGPLHLLPDNIRSELLHGIDLEVDYLDRLVKNLLDMSRIEAGQLVPNRDWHPIEELVEAAVRRGATSLDGRRLEIHLPEDSTPVYVDAVEIQQVLVNLLDNAVKYSIDGSPIRLTAERCHDTLVISVSNEGEGIAPEEANRIFDRFYRIRTKRERTVRGSGLGLAICQGIVAAHGGKISVRSSPGEMTTVTITIPCRQPDQGGPGSLASQKSS